MNEELKEAINWLSALDVKSEYEATNKEIILSELDKKDREIENYKKGIKNYKKVAQIYGEEYIDIDDFFRKVEEENE